MAPGQVRVLHSLRPDFRRGTNPFVHQLVDSLPAEIESRFWTWRGALFGRYDVVHLQWVEYNLRSRNRVKRLTLRLGMLLVCVRWWLTGQAVVTTVHNARPHEAGGATERRLLQWIEALTTHRVHLNAAATSGPSDSTILHGHYRARLVALPAGAPIPGRVVYFGSIRAYKNVLGLAGAFVGLSTIGPDIPGATPASAPTTRSVPSLHVVGACPDLALRAELTRLAGVDPRISVALSSVPEDQLVQEVRAAQLVVLPYTEMMNSGALLLALSCGRPALVPATPANLALSVEVGERWIQTFEGPLTTECLDNALRTAARADSWPEPDLSAREWDDGGRQYAVLYRGLAPPARRRDRRPGPG